MLGCWRDERIADLYDLWYEKKFEILKTYTNELPPKIPLSENKEFKSIKNEIIREAMRIHRETDTSIRIELPPKRQGNDNNPADSQPHRSAHPKAISATAVTRLFRGLANLFQDKIGGDSKKKLPVIDRRQRREIEEKRNAEISLN